MNEQEFEQCVHEKAALARISVDDVGNQERTLVYGYDHLACVHGGEVHVLVYREIGEARHRVGYWHGRSLPAEIMRPSKRAWPDITDLEFARLAEQLRRRAGLSRLLRLRRGDGSATRREGALQGPGPQGPLTAAVGTGRGRYHYDRPGTDDEGMSMSDLSAKLVYGFEIGVSGAWQVEQAQAVQGGQRPQLITPWYNDVDHYPNFLTHAWNQLYEQIPPAYRPPAQGDAQKRNIAESYYTVTFEDVGMADQPNRVLVVTDLRIETASAADVLPINPGALQARPISGRYTEKLRRALTALGLTPVQPHPQWMLAGLHL